MNAQIEDYERKILIASYFGRETLDHFQEVLGKGCIVLKEVINHLVDENYLQPKGKYSDNSVTYRITEKGKEYIEADISRQDQKYLEEGLTNNDIEFLKIVKKNPGKMKSLLKDNREGNSNLPPVSISYLEEKGFLQVKGIFRSKIYINDDLFNRLGV